MLSVPWIFRWKIPARRLFEACFHLSDSRWEDIWMYEKIMKVCDWINGMIMAEDYIIIIITYPRICLWNLPPKMASADSWSHFPYMNKTNTNRWVRTPAVQIPWFPRRPPTHVLTYIRTQHWLDLWTLRPAKKKTVGTEKLESDSDR